MKKTDVGRTFAAAGGPADYTVFAAAACNDVKKLAVRSAGS